MADESLTLGSMNLRLVEDAKEAMSRGDWMLALSLFEQSRRICIDEGWREGVHYADDMILNIYPMVKRQIDDSYRVPAEKPGSAKGGLGSTPSPQWQAGLQSNSHSGKEVDEDDSEDQVHGIPGTDNKKAKADTFDYNPAARRLRRMIGEDRESKD
jgi:hypothetical protein